LVRTLTVPIVEPTTPVRAVLERLAQHPCVLVGSGGRITGICTPESICLHLASEMAILASPEMGWGTFLPDHPTLEGKAADQVAARPHLVRADIPFSDLVRAVAHGPVVLVAPGKEPQVATAASVLGLANARPDTGPASG
jgi:hypothetical protein